MRLKAILALVSGIALLGAPLALPKGTGQFRDARYGVAVWAPSGWWFESVQQWGSQQNTLRLMRQSSQVSAAFDYRVFTPPEKMTLPELEKQMMRQITGKVAQRQQEGLHDYHVRENTTETRTINGRPALSWIADYTQGGHQMSEYLVRVRSGSVNALFYASTPADELEKFRQDFDQIVGTIELP